MNKTAISWSNRTWNSIHGCSKVSDGCKHCYAMTLSLKNGWTKHDWTVQHESENVLMKPHKLHEPYTLTEPQRVFTNSMSDMFHRAVPDWYRAAMFCVMLDLPQHVFQVLTKRSEALADWDVRFLAAVRSDEFKVFAATVKRKDVKAALEKAEAYTSAWADHIWQGVSVEDGRVLHRIDDLRRCAAHVKFISAEPLLGAWGADVDLSGIDWIIVGGESGEHMIVTDDSGKRVPNEKRWMKMEWAREIKALCVDQGTAFFYKQDSGYNTEQRKYLVEEDGTHWEWNQYPGDLVPPRELGKAYNYFGEIHQTEDTSLNLCLYMAHLWENRAYANEGFRADNAAITSAYWYAAAARLRPAPPQAVTTPDPLLADEHGLTDAGLEVLRADSGGLLHDPLLTTALDLGATVTPADPDPIPAVPLAKVEPDYADPFGLPETAKVISVRPVYAVLLMTGEKHIEWRNWQPSNFKAGTLVIHASQVKQEDLDLAASEPFASALRAHGYDPAKLPSGVALGTVILDRIVPGADILDVLSDKEKAFGYATEDNKAWCVSRPRFFREPIPLTGALGLRAWNDVIGVKRDETEPPADLGLNPDPATAVWVGKYVLAPDGSDGVVEKIQDGEAMIGFHQQAAWVPLSEVKPHPSRTTTVYTAQMSIDDLSAIDITVKSADTPIGKFFAPTWDMVNGVKAGTISEAQYTKLYEDLLRSRYAANAGLLKDFLWERRRVVFKCFCGARTFCHRHIAVEVLEKIGMKFGFTVVRGGELEHSTAQPEPERVETAPVQMSLFGDGFAPKKKTYA